MRKVAIITTAFGNGLEDRISVYKDLFEEENLCAWYCTRDELMKQPQNVLGVIVGVEKADKDFFSSCSDLKVAMKFGVGLDNFDIDTATQLGIKVSNLPGINSDAVAEMTISLALSVSRKICTLHQGCKDGEFKQICSNSILGKTLGLIGVGTIGRKVAEVFKVFGIRVVGYDPFVQSAKGIELMDLPDVLRCSDIVSVHVPFTKENFHLLDKESFRIMKKGAIVLNTSRGGIVDDVALAQSIKDGYLGGAGIDVYETKGTASLLMENEAVVCTPHVAAYTHETLRHMEQTIIHKMSVLLDETR